MTDFSVQISKKTETTLNDETIADQHVGNTPSITTIYPITYPSKQDEKKRVRRRSIIRDFSLNTSTHGLSALLEVKVNIIVYFGRYHLLFLLV